jgi:hypothetical protein
MLRPRSLPKHAYAVVGGTVTTAWALVLVDAFHREDWEDVEPFRHFGSALLLLTAAGVAAALFFLALTALAGAARRAVERRYPRGTSFVEPAFAAAVAVALSYTTAFWVFSGERIHRSPVARWGPYALLLFFALGTALAAAGLRYLSRRELRGVPLVAFSASAWLTSALFIRIDVLVYPTLYDRLHTLLELTAFFVSSVAAAVCLAAVARNSERRGTALVRFASIASLSLPALVLIAPSRHWVEEALWYAWREPVYLGRMLSRLQTVESFVRRPRDRASSLTPAIERLLQRHDLTTSGQSPEWSLPNDETPPMRERLLALRDRKSYNIVVFYVDTLRADFARNAALMPNVARFSASAMDFRRAYTTGSDTLHALPGIVGGSYDLYDQPDRDLFYYARSAGHRTGLVAAKSAREFLTNLLPRFRFDDVTDVPDYADGRADVWGYGADQSTASRVVDSGIEWLQKHRAAPHLLWLFNFDLHNWREIDLLEAQRMAEVHGLHDEKDPIWRYKALVRSIDVQFGRLLDALDGLDAAKDTVVLFVSDHGEGLGQDGFWVHSVFLWESLVHVPLLIRAPGLPARRVDDVVSLVDVAPTLTRYLARRAETNHFHGHDLLEHAVNEHPRRRHPLVMMGVLNQVPVRLGVIDGSTPYKLVLPLEGAVPELYDLRSTDPDGRDFSREHPEVVHHLLKRLVRAPTFPRSGVAALAGASAQSGGPEGPGAEEEAR